jgi:ATP-dependent RNA helicase SUPV3L1/SUV3
MPGDKPAGSADGRGFTVTVAMTSLVGCAGEDFANILRALGYRMERRPTPPAEAKSEVATTATPVPDETAAIAATESPQVIPVTAELLDTATPSAPIQPEPLVETVAEAPSEATLQPAEAVPAAAAFSEPAMIEVWRPGRPRDERRPPRRQERDRRTPQMPQSPVPADAAKASEVPAPEAKRERPPKHKSQKRERPERERHAGRTNRPDREQRPPRERERKRERPIDPNSPFAALLELKARLEAGQKNES